MKEVIIDGVAYELTPKGTKGNPPRIQRVFIDVYPVDAPDAMPWEEAVNYCRLLGNGWRLPNRHELLLMYENSGILGGFADDGYWSSSECNSFSAWRQGFASGYQGSGYKNVDCRVRAVRDGEEQ
jgi:hypothetical protein